MTRRDQIRNAYRLTGNNASFYDGMMTYSTLPGKVICRLVWNMDGKKNLRCPACRRASKESCWKFRLGRES